MGLEHYLHCSITLSKHTTLFPVLYDIWGHHDVYSHLESVNMEAVGVTISVSGEDTGVSINATPVDLESSGVVEYDGVLDDTLLDAVTPRHNPLDEPVTDVLPRTICTRCRSISASFLSSPYLLSGGTTGADNVSVSSHERCVGREATPDMGTRADITDDDEPLIRVSLPLL